MKSIFKLLFLFLILNKPSLSNAQQIDITKSPIVIEDSSGNKIKSQIQSNKSANIITQAAASASCLTYGNSTFSGGYLAPQSYYMVGSPFTVPCTGIASITTTSLSGGSINSYVAQYINGGWYIVSNGSASASATVTPGNTYAYVIAVQYFAVNSFKGSISTPISR